MASTSAILGENSLTMSGGECWERKVEISLMQNELNRTIVTNVEVADMAAEDVVVAASEEADEVVAVDVVDEEVGVITRPTLPTTET